MEGVFLRKRYVGLLALWVLCGVYFIGRFVYMCAADSGQSGEARSFLLVGILICIAAIPSCLMNRHAFIRIDESTVQARYGWFGRIDGRISDVDFAVAQGNTLSIRMKNGKQHTVMGVSNAQALCAAIRGRLEIEVKDTPEKMIEVLDGWKEERKKGIVRAVVGIALMFVWIFAAVLMTGGREMYAFGRRDWAVMAVMGCAEAATAAAAFGCACRAGKYILPIEKLKYTVRRTTVETTPLLPGNAVGVFTDADRTGRITLYGFPNEEAVYYTVQEFASDLTFIKVYESEIYENAEAIRGGLDALLDITEEVLYRS